MSRRRWGGLPVALVGLLLALTWLLMRSATPDVALHQRTLGALHAVILHDAALQRDVLKARAGLLRNYDPLVEAVGDLRAATTDLQAAARTASDAAARAELGRRRERLAEAVAAQEAQVEVFKSRNALLQNSSSLFAHASHRLGTLGRGESDAVAVEVAGLANAMLSFMGDPGPEHAASLTAALDRLAGLPASPPLADDLRALVAHGRLIAATLPAVDETLGRILAGPVSGEARALQAAYLEQHGRAEARAGTFRVLLYVASLLLLGYLGHLFLRLRATARTLAARLRFERLIAGIAAGLIDPPDAGLGEAVERSLGQLGAHLHADRAYLLWRGGGTEDERTFRWRRDAGDPESPAGLRDLPALAAGWRPKEHERHGCLLVPRVAGLPAGPERAVLSARGARSWLGVPLWHGGRRVGLLGFETVRDERRWPADDAALLRTAGESLSGALERERAAAEREALAARLRRAERMEAVGTLAGGIAHDFNNILGAILGYAEMALAGLPADGRPAGHVRQVMLAGERAKGLVDQILAFARRGGERRRRPVRVQAVVEEALALLRASLPATVDLRPHLAAPDAVVQGDPGRLQQVAINLCTNAAQAMDGRGVIEIGLDTVEVTDARALSHGDLAPGRYVRLAVRDTGRGMDAATLARIFEPFFTTKPTGTGLGLASVHGIVAEHGGALNVISRPGEGSTFEAWLAATAEAAEPARDEVPPPARGHGETVLLVDDERPLVRLGEEMLAALGYEPAGFDSATKALAAFTGAPGRFDLVLTDEVMPEMTGTELASALHAVRPDLPILLVTGHADPASPERRRAAGIREVLGKPLRSRALAEALARHRPSGG